MYSQYAIDQDNHEIYNMPSAVRQPGTLKSLLDRIITRIALMERVRSERAALSRLNQKQLRDIGVSVVDARREYSRSYFNVPVDRVSYSLVRNYSDQ